MLSLNVSFGIFAFLPQGWLFMLFVIMIECGIVNYYLSPQPQEPNPTVYKSVLLANFISGITGIILSLLHNGGWYLVVWFPWVSKHEVQISDVNALFVLIVYYLIAFGLSVAIELWVNIRVLKTVTEKRTIVRATLVANIVSYAIGSLVLYSYSFS